jgi:hypothetical protein
MIFRDISEQVPLGECVWCIPKHNREPDENPKLGIVVLGMGKKRINTSGHDACDYLYGDVVRVPDVVEIERQSDARF